MVAVHGAAERQIRPDIEALLEFVALVALVRAGPETCELGFALVLLGELVGAVITVRQHGDGAGGFQPSFAGIFAASVQARVGFNSHALRLVEGDAPGGMPGIGSQHGDVLNLLRLGDGPL